MSSKTRSFFAKKHSIEKHMNDNANGGKSQLLFQYGGRSKSAQLGGDRKTIKSVRKTTKKVSKPKLVWRKPEETWTGNSDMWVEDPTDVKPEHSDHLERKYYQSLIKKEQPTMTYGEQKELVQNHLSESKAKLDKMNFKPVDGETYVKSFGKKKVATRKRSRKTKTKKYKSKKTSRKSKSKKRSRKSKSKK